MDTNFVERIYVDPETLEIVLEHPSTTERCFNQYAAFQAMFSVGVRRTCAVVTGVWYDVDEDDVFNITRLERARLVGLAFKRGIKVWYPISMQLRVVRAVVETPQAIFYSVAEPWAELHEHYVLAGKEPYRQLAQFCEVCDPTLKRYVIEPQGNLSGLEFTFDTETTDG